MATADELFRRAVIAHQTGDLEAAEQGYRQLLEAAPDHAPCLSNLASILARRGETREAEHLFTRASAADPDCFDAHFNYGNLCRRLGRPREAAAAYANALRVAPYSAPTLINLGLAVSDDGDWPRAVECFARAATIAPHLPDVLNMLGDALVRCGRIAEAVVALRESVGRFPDSTRSLHNLGLYLTADGSPHEAVTCFERALALDPTYAEAHNAMGLALDALGRTDDAQRAYREATRLRPTLASAWSNLGASFGEQGQVPEAIETLQRAQAIAPDAATGSALLTNLMFSADLSAEQLRDEHLAWAEEHANQLTPIEPPRRVLNVPLRVGYVFDGPRSPTASRFLESLFTHHDRQQFHITAYAGAPGRGGIIDPVYCRADSWKPVANQTDTALAETIRADGIDILVDLNGHAPDHRLLTFAYKPALKQISLSSYPATTGLRAMDFRVTDATADPPDSDSLYVEKLLRLPDLGWLFVPPADAPGPNSLPAADGRAFTFGCLDHPGKLSEPCVEAWAAILKAVPKSRLVLLAGQTATSRDALVERFTRRGLAPDRLELVLRLPTADPLEAYQPIDLALDPFPHGGVVTTCEALWMGIPVLTVAGRDARGRQATSVLSALGLPEFVADNSEQLVSLAATWADQRDALADIRSALREMMTQSPVTDAANYVRNLEAAYRAVCA